MKKKCIITIITLFILLFCNVTVSNAAVSDIWGTAKNWIALGKDRQGEVVDNPKWTSFNDLAGILWGAGVFIIAIVGTIIGIKYMFSSVEGKAAIKESIWPFAIGAVIILGALTIWKFAVDILAGI